jgi:hypothetical protein
MQLAYPAGSDLAKDLTASKMKIVDLEQEDRNLSAQEEAFGMRHKELLVGTIFPTVVLLGNFESNRALCL